MHAVGTRVGIPPTRYHDAGDGFAGSRGIDLGHEPFERSHRFFDSALSELDLDRGPPPVTELDDRIGLGSCRITIVEHFSIERLCIHAQISDHQRLEEQTERAGIAQEPIRAPTHCGDRQ